jgi:hypothetical protein
MKHSVPELFVTVYQYYPRGLATDAAGYKETDAYRRLSEARRRAGADHEAWSGMLYRIGEQFPDNLVQNRSLHLPMGDLDACYCGMVHLDTTPAPHPLPAPDPDDVCTGDARAMGFLISFICPYYVIYSSRFVDDLAATAAALAVPRRDTVDIYSHDTMHVVPANAVKPEIRAEAERKEEQRRRRLQQKPLQRRVIAFDLSPDEQPYAAALKHEIAATFGGDPMPPEVGEIIVPDVSTNLRGLGDARLYDCLLSDSW